MENRRGNRNHGLLGVEKAAIFFITLGPEKSAKVMKLLPEKMIEKITYEISNITKVEPAMREEVLKDFIDMNENYEYFKEGGVDYAREILTKALGAPVNKILVIVLEPLRISAVILASSTR